MDIQEIKHQNLIRLAKERNCDEPARLGRVLGVTIQHASQLLLGKVGIGNKTIKRLCAAWGISENEFVIDPQNTTKGGSGTELSDQSWELKLILESMNKRMDEQREFLSGLEKVLTRYRDEHVRMWEVVNSLQASLVNVNKAIDVIHENMELAARTGDISKLGGGARKRQIKVAPRLRVICGNKKDDTHTQHNLCHVKN